MPEIQICLPKPISAAYIWLKGAWQMGHHPQTALLEVSQMWYFNGWKGFGYKRFLYAYRPASIVKWLRFFRECPPEGMGPARSYRPRGHILNTNFCLYWTEPRPHPSKRPSARNLLNYETSCYPNWQPPNKSFLRLESQSLNCSSIYLYAFVNPLNKVCAHL